MRLLAVEGCAAIGKLLDKQDCINSILPIILAFAQVHFSALRGSLFCEAVLSVFCSDAANQEMLCCRHHSYSLAEEGLCFGLVLTGMQDKSWRVRYMVANQLHELCEAVGAEVAR